ncbi:MAG: HEAT repeat domain-containing protein [Candidatus Sumerlaeia bacterium]
MNRKTLSFALIASVMLLQGCAILNRDNTIALNWVEANLVPDSQPARGIAMPFVFTVGVAAVSADAFIIHPATVIDDAAEDTKDCLWEDFDWDKEYVTECASLPWRAAFTPIMFAGDWLGRSMFDITESAEKARQQLPKDVDLSRFQATIDEGRVEQGLKDLEKFEDEHRSAVNEDPTLRARISLIRLKACARDDYHPSIPTGFGFMAFHINREGVDPAVMAQIDQELNRMEASQDPAKRWIAYSVGFGGDAVLATFQRAMKDPDPVVRYLAVQRVGLSHSKDEPIRNALGAVATSDAEPMVRECARGVLNDDDSFMRLLQ